jgi:E1A/CREB-binding protein
LTESLELLAELPPSDLSNFLEARIREMLRSTREQVGEVTVRILSCRDKLTRVKPELVEYLKEEGYTMPEELPYRGKAVFLFQKLDGIDVCFFGFDL